MSSKVLEIGDNGDVSFKCDIKRKTVIVTVEQEAIEDVIGCGDSYAEMSETGKENLVASILVALTKEEANNRLLSEYRLTAAHLRKIMVKQ